MFTFTNHISLLQKPERLAIKLSANGEFSVIKEHPWIFSKSIVKISKPGRTGDLCIVFSKNKNKVIGIGLFDPDSPIRIKMIHFGEGTTINEAFFEAKVKQAYHLRSELFTTDTNSYRLLFGENDGFPGLIADVYNKVLVVKLYSKIWLPYLEMILKALITTSQCETVVIRLSRNLQSDSNLGMQDGDIVYGELHDETVLFKEHGIQFSANVIKGHKTGYFLDHRHNRKRVGELSKNKRVLDVFAYAGGFSVHALVNAAKEVTSLDISEHALKLAQSNAALNNYSGQHKIIVDDAFKALKELASDDQKYDIVVIDPPSFAKQQSEIQIAKKKYRQLAEMGQKITANNGILILASCSSRVLAEDFFNINYAELKRSGRTFNCILKTYHDIDHPIAFKEGAYLKCGYYQFFDN
ncbi:MAG: class I SAM-dependent rRNA methyltransferase [Flavobacteriaceae bacterium]|nr:methyltransferase domain-containing protein [Flavobacteriaceae bacterium]NNL34136.1 methyltransferase domain-containing protein [Flavobacteriaceae bacterium]RZW54947.1 MAG: class I SAM-dependent rRNA methyltransferase [Flavobacteriaceae bacterium]